MWAINQAERMGLLPVNLLICLMITALGCVYQVQTAGASLTQSVVGPWQTEIIAAETPVNWGGLTPVIRQEEEQRTRSPYEDRNPVLLL